MVAIAGLRGTGNWATDERPKNFREMILWRNPNGNAPLTALMGKMKTTKTDDPEFSWYEEENNLTRVTISGTLITAATTCTLVSGGYDLVPGDVLMVEKTEAATFDNELILVSAVTSDTAITIVRAAAGTTAAQSSAGASFTKVGNVYSEGSGSPDTSTRNPTKVLNYCQIFKTAYEMTNTAKITKTRTGDPLKNDKKRKMFDHSVAMELAWMFGVKNETTGANGKPQRMTGGLSQFITTNRTIFTTSPTEDTLLDAVYPVFDYNTEGGNGGGNERIVFAGNGFLNNLNKLARDSASTRINFNGKVTAYGMSLQEWILPQGTLYIKTHPLMNTHPRYTNAAFVIDPSNIIYRPFRDTKMQDNIQNNDEDTQKGQWLTEAGIEIQHEKTMAYIGNFVI
jgi:hypothetical protein